MYQLGDTGNVRQDLDSNCVADSFNNGPYYHYWTLNFGSRQDVYPVVVNREAYGTLYHYVNLYVYGSGSATQMRFRNEAGAWSAWEAYVANKLWRMSLGNGTKEVHAETRDSFSVWAASDTIELTAPVCTAVDDDLYLSNQTINNVQLYEACMAIFAGENGFHVAYPGDVTLRSPWIVLRNGFSVADGAVLHVVNEVP